MVHTTVWTLPTPKFIFAKPHIRRCQAPRCRTCCHAGAGLTAGKSSPLALLLTAGNRGRRCCRRGAAAAHARGRERSEKELLRRAGGSQPARRRDTASQSSSICRSRPLPSRHL
nr:hypothetical protein Iba_chr06bCG12510 [Ipomoea batatas]